MVFGKSEFSRRKSEIRAAVAAGKPLEVMKLEDINKGFDPMHEGKSIRSVVVCGSV